MGCSEHSDSDFLVDIVTSRRSSNEECKRTYTAVCYEDLGERPAVSCGFPAHGLDVVHGSAGCTGRPDEGVGQPRRMEDL